MCVVAVALLTTVAACSSGTDSAQPAPQSPVVQVSVSSCGKGWSDGPAGARDIAVHNTDSRPGSVDLIDPRSDAVYAEVEPLAAGTTETLHVDLGAGHYAFRCAMEDEPMVTGSTFTLAGSHRGDTPAVRAVDQGDLVPATQAYEKYVIGRLPHLLALARALRSDIAGNDLAGARRDWAPAQLSYLSLGAAYSAFGDLDADIDARADGLPKGVRDPAWHGLRRIEYGLWHGQSAARLTPLSDALVRDVAALRRQFPQAQLDPLEIAIRAHEITEDAVEFTLTSRDDYGSHVALSAVREDVGATRTVLRMVRPVLAPRFAGMDGLAAQLTRTDNDIEATRHGGRWPALNELPRATRERINADVSELAEQLAPVASILEPRRTQ